MRMGVLEIEIDFRVLVWEIGAEVEGGVAVGDIGGDPYRQCLAKLAPVQVEPHILKHTTVHDPAFWTSLDIIKLANKTYG